MEAVRIRSGRGAAVFSGHALAYASSRSWRNEEAGGGVTEVTLETLPEEAFGEVTLEKVTLEMLTEEALEAWV
jgi:hypothetical protein